MSIWETFLYQENMLQFLAICACAILVAYLLSELINPGINAGCSAQNQAKIMRTVYGYSLENGPHMWKELCPASRGTKQSPVNIITQDAVLVDSAAPLAFNNYSCAPTHMYLLNNGNSVVLQGCWPADARPTLSGGPTGGVFQFQTALFRWGLSDAEGSEHTVNHMAFPLELQALHARAGPAPPPAPAPALVAVAYLFELTEVDNPYLDPVVLALPHVACPGSAVELMPFVLSWLCPPFASKYFTYDGSLTFPPCSESVRWIVRPSPIGISRQQAAAFRALVGWDGPLRANLRPVQALFCRDVFYYADGPADEQPEAAQRADRPRQARVRFADSKAARRGSDLLRRRSERCCDESDRSSRSSAASSTTSAGRPTSSPKPCCAGAGNG